MQRRIIQGREYIFKKPRIGNITVTVLAIATHVGSDLVSYSSYRPEELNEVGQQAGTTKPASEFFEEMDIMVTFLQKNGLTDANFENSLFALCEDHISKFSRLIDNDLYAYVDQAVILLNSIMSEQNSSLPPDDARTAFKTLLTSVIKRYKSVIYTTNYRQNNFGQIEPYLTKLI